MKSVWTIPGAILIGGVVVALAVYFSIAPPPNSGGSGKGNPTLVRPVGSTDHILGSPTAPIQIVVYSDFNCAHCNDFHNIMHEIVANEGARGNVAWVFRHFPLTELKGHEHALKHAEASECAAKVGGNDAFWKFADALYRSQPVDPSQYGVLAASVGIPGDAFSQCYTGSLGEIDRRIAADRQNALDTGALGAPYSLLLKKGQPPVVMVGAYPYDAVKILIDQALAL